MKNHGRLGRNYLLGKEGGRMSVILCGAGHNIRKLLRAFLIVSFLAAVQNLFSIRQRIKNPLIFT
jgi:IS5 family transposase